MLGQSHFIKTVEDLYEALINSAPQIKFGVAFNEVHPARVSRRADGNDPELREAAVAIASAVAAGHFFAVVMRDAYPINSRSGRSREHPRCAIFSAATANPVEVIVAETEQGRGVLGVIDGSSPKGVESEDQAAQRHAFLRRKIGYKR